MTFSTKEARLIVAREYDVLADLQDQYALGLVTRQDVWKQESKVNRTISNLHRANAKENYLLRAIRALAGLDREFLLSTPPTAMVRTVERRGWKKTGEIPFPGEPSRVAFWTYDRDAFLGDKNGILPSVGVPQDPTSEDYALRVAEWSYDLAVRSGDVSAAEILAEAWGTS